MNRSVMIQDDIRLVEARLKQFETNTGCELLLVVASSSDPYPAAPWRFGLMSSFVIMLIFSFYFEFHHALIWPVSFFALTLFMVWIGHFPWAKRLALSEWEVERETLEKAIEYFHTLGTSKSSHKVTAMIMVSMLEHEIHILVDEKLKTQITQTELDQLLEVAKKHFKQGDLGLGFTQTIQALEDKILKDFGGKVTDINPAELKDTIHFI